MDCSSPGSSVHGILQARILEWVAISFSRGSFRPKDRTHIAYVSCIAGGFFTASATREALRNSTRPELRPTWQACGAADYPHNRVLWRQPATNFTFTLSLRLCNSSQSVYYSFQDFVLLASGILCSVLWPFGGQLDPGTPQSDSLISFMPPEVFSELLLGEIPC